MKKIVVVLFLTVFTNTFAQANKADVLKLVELSGEVKEFYNIADEISKQLSVTNRESFKKDMEPLIAKQKRNLIAYYSQNLSQSEVENLIEFYQTPLAKKFMMVKSNYAVVLSNRSEAFKAEIQGIIMKYMM
ncbi:DUF2059 domain-containing protein [Flavobacterium sp. CBA20B-1]|uniref:DUF2059 domain-containing protein n=1 Tax=unclassified Flavobacterium TaxID=196869 RepID=UPI00222532C8|nr:MULTISPECIES: DUF2059 domain-containing protein [unclassified Flavobacterium]WCM41849.1 DUF2059 domain-containing protein [Flavobacterium sp. CBA20B-1]